MLAQNVSSREEPKIVLESAEHDYKSGQIDKAVSVAKELLIAAKKQRLSGQAGAYYPETDIKSDMVLFQLKAGRADESARLIREMLLDLQLVSPMMKNFSTSPADAYFEGPLTLKTWLKWGAERLGESSETKLIVDSLVDNTVPKNYSQQLKTYCNNVQEALKRLDDIHTITDSEELKYGDPLSSLDVLKENKSDSRLSKANLDKLASRFDELATAAQQLPVGDARPALALYRVALAANSAGRFEQAESFARKSISHINAISDDVSGTPDVRVALAFAVAKQGKSDEFNALKKELLENYFGRERLLISLARFSEATGDGAGALEVYKVALDNRKRNQNTQKPDWLDDYNDLLKKQSEAPQSPRHDLF